MLEKIASRPFYYPGQLLDEMAILWVIMAGFAMWFPKDAMPVSLKDEKGRKTFIMTVKLLFSFLCFKCFKFFDGS